MNLFEAHLDWAERQAAMFISRLKTRGQFDPGEIEQAAIMGLWTAAQTYDGTRRDATFRTYARPRVRGAMQDLVRERTSEARAMALSDGLVTVRPANVADQEYVERVLESLPRETGREIVRLRMEGRTLDQIAEELQVSRAWVLACLREARENLARRSHERLRKLTEVVRLRTAQGYSIAQIAAHLGLPPNRVRMMWKEGVARIKRRL